MGAAVTGCTLIVDCLEQRTLIARKVAGAMETKPIAANIDLLLSSTVWQSSTTSTYKRYLVPAPQAQITPLVLLTVLSGFSLTSLTVS